MKTATIRKNHVVKTGYLIDMDGVIYRENRLIPGAKEFVDALTATGTPFLFLTNNSVPTPENLAVRLKQLGIQGISAKHFYISAMNMADFLSETDPGCTVFVTGESGLIAALHECKIANDAIQPRYIVVGEVAITMDKLVKAHECIERGARLLATNPDNCSPSPAKKPAPVQVPQQHSLRPAPGSALIISANQTGTCFTGPAANSRNSPAAGWNPL